MPNATALNQDLLVYLWGPIIAMFLSRTVPGAAVPQIWAEILTEFIFLLTAL